MLSFVAPYSLVRDVDQQALMNIAAGTPPGDFMEVGVYRGGTAWHLGLIAQCQGRQLHLFDTFTGIPEAGPEDLQHKVGDFAETSEAYVRSVLPDPHINFYVGFFPQTIPVDWFNKERFISFLHVDCDQYQSTKQCIKFFQRFALPGAVILFDDYLHTSGSRQAIEEHIPDDLRLYTPSGRPFARV